MRLSIIGIGIGIGIIIGMPYVFKLKEISSLEI